MADKGPAGTAGIGGVDLACIIVDPLVVARVHLNNGDLPVRIGEEHGVLVKAVYQSLNGRPRHGDNIVFRQNVVGNV